MVIYTTIAAILVIGVTVIGNKGFTSGIKKENTQMSAAENKISVKVQPVKTLEKTVSMFYKANLEPGEEGIVSSKLSGKVVEILFDNGKTVSQGDPLVKIDDQDIKNNIATAKSQLAIAETQLKSSENQLLSAQTTLQKLQINLDSSKTNYDRMKALFEQGGVSKAEFEKAESALKVAKSDYDSAKIGIESSRLAIETAKANVNSVIASINNLNDTLSNTIIKAPMQGTMDENSVKIGQFISAGTVLAKVKNISNINAVIQIEQSNLKYVKEGMKAQIKLDDSGSQTYEGTVKSINVSADSSTRVFSCKIQVDNTNSVLHPGTFAKIEMMSDQKREAMEVPIQALSGSEGSYSVFVFQNDKAQKRSVSVGDISKDTAEILSGLKKDESIIITNLNILQDGDPVSVSE
jgi:multidrug efflux pump subunit AcrA (membrane-fusion protein)